MLSGLSKGRLHQACDVNEPLAKLLPKRAQLAWPHCLHTLLHITLPCSRALLRPQDGFPAMSRHSQTERWHTSTAVVRQGPASHTSTRRSCHCPWQKAAAAQAAPSRAQCWRPASRPAPSKRALCPCAACHTSAMLQCWGTGMCSQSKVPSSHACRLPYLVITANLGTNKCLDLYRGCWIPAGDQGTIHS